MFSHVGNCDVAYMAYIHAVRDDAEKTHKSQAGALTVCYWQRGLHVRIGEPRRFRFSGPALVVPRLNDRVRPTPSTTHRDNHPRQVRLTRAERGSGSSHAGRRILSRGLYCGSIRGSVSIVGLRC